MTFPLVICVKRAQYIVYLWCEEQAWVSCMEIYIKHFFLSFLMIENTERPQTQNLTDCWDLKGNIIMDENGSSSNEPKNNNRNLPVSVFFKDARYPYILSHLFHGGATSFNKQICDCKILTLGSTTYADMFSRWTPLLRRYLGLHSHLHWLLLLILLLLS